jgi:CRISPR-associated protein Cas6
MFWEEEKDENSAYVVPDDVVDIVYSIDCKCLPLDHAYSFSTAICSALPWMNDEPRAGIHLIHGAESGNGWMRPEDCEHQLLHLSKRSRMTLRVPGHRVADAESLAGAKLDIDGHALLVGKPKVKLLSTLPTQFARYVVVPESVHRDDEAAFTAWAVEQIRSLDIHVRKLLCGRSHTLQHPDGDVPTRSIMLADLDVEEAIRLQQAGVGAHRKLGCGLFMPHKGIKAVHELIADKK